VGIGTAQPRYPLDVKGSQRIGNTGDRVTDFTMTPWTDNSKNFVLRNDNGETSYNAVYGHIFRTHQSTLTVNVQPSLPYDSIAMTILQNGNVGIGTVNPLAKLHLPYGGGSIQNSIRIGGIETTYSEAIYSILWGGSGQMGMGPYPTARGVFGRQGLGIHVISTEEISFKSSGWDNLFGVAGGTGNVYIKGDIQCIGSRSSDVPWNDNFKLWSRAQAGYSELHVHFGNVGGSTPAAQLRFMYGNSVAFRTARDGFGFEYGWVTLSGSFPSTIKYKYNVNPLSLGLKDVLLLNPVEFQWKTDICGNKKDDFSFGFIAEEMKSINEMYVQYDMDGNIETVRYQLLTSLLTKAIQEMHSEFCDTKTISGMVQLNNGTAIVNIYDVLKISAIDFTNTWYNIRRLTSNESGFARVKSIYEDGILTVICEDISSCDEVFWQLTANVK